MNGLFARFLFLLCAFIAPKAAMLAANPAHLTEFPAVERVLAEIKGRDARDTSAKQVGALRQLWHMVASLAFGRAETPEESRLRQTYNVASGQIDRPMMASFNQADTDRLGMQSPRAKWVALCSMYENDEDLRNELLTRFFSPTFKSRFARAIADGQRVQKHTSAELGQSGAGEAPQWLVNLPWYKGPAFVLAAVTILFALWLLHGITGELKPFGLDPGNTRLLHAGRRRYLLESITGIVVNHTKGTIHETTERRIIDRDSLNGEIVTSFTRSTIIHHFDLAQPDGTNPMIALDHHHADIQAGDRASVVNFKKKGKKYGEWLLYCAHERERLSYDRPRLRALFRPRYTLLVSGVAVLTCLGLYARAISDYPSNHANFPTLFDFSGSVAHKFYDVIVQLWVPNWKWWLGGLVVGWIVFKAIGVMRTSSFIKRGSRTLLAEFATEAAKQTALGFDREAALRAHPPRPT